MTNRYRLYRRKGVFYLQDNQTGRQRSLRTSARCKAERLLHTHNEAAQTASINRELGRVYLAAADPELTQRTWATVMADYCSKPVRASTQLRNLRAVADPAFNLIRKKSVVETSNDDFLKVLKQGGTATNHYLRRFHNHALGMGWLNWPILPSKRWPKPQARSKRAVRPEEHQRIIETEPNVERRMYYEVIWHTGGSQSDIAGLTADNIDWEQRILWFQRRKLPSGAEPARISIGPKLEALLRQLPKSGPLFPYWGKFEAKDRAAEFRRRCRILGIDGVSLHCYRNAWAERAFETGYPERYALANLGHSSRAVHHAYARRAKVVSPSLEKYEEAAAAKKEVPSDQPGRPDGDMNYQDMAVNDPLPPAADRGTASGQTVTTAPDCGTV